MAGDREVLHVNIMLSPKKKKKNPNHNENTNEFVRPRSGLRDGTIMNVKLYTLIIYNIYLFIH